MFKLSDRLDKKVYWANALWLLIMSVLPYATSFAGRFPNYREPMMFYLFIQILWGASYSILNRTLANSNSSKTKEILAVGALPNNASIPAIVAFGIISLTITYFIPLFTWVALAIVLYTSMRQSFIKSSDELIKEKSND